MKSNLLYLISSWLVITVHITTTITSVAHGALTTEYLAANGLNFTCTVLKHTSSQNSNPDDTPPTKEILLLHGFPMFRVWWLPLLEYWDDLLQQQQNNGDGAMSATNVHAVACDLRGYSPGASPDTIEEYDYSILAQDAFELAKASGFNEGRFHLLGHDHGAALAWYIAENDPYNMVLSLTTLSVPHIGLMSHALCGNNTDEAQVMASNYFNQFALADSAFRNNASLTKVFQSFGMQLEPEQFQKMLWWYNGSIPKHWSMPRVVSDAEIDEFEATYGPEITFFVKATRSAIPMEERPCIPVDEEENLLVNGPIEIPTLFVCGTQDFALLCNNSYVTNYPPELLPNYEHTNFDCGHDFFGDGDCASTEESQAVMKKITSFVFGGEGSSSLSTTTTTTTGEDATDTTTQDVVESSSANAAGASSQFLKLARKIPLVLASGGSIIASSSMFW